MLESIEKLRNKLKREFSVLSVKDLEHHLDLIEAEIARCYKKLPLDANNTPIDEGDTWVSLSGEVKKIQAISHDCVYVLDEKCRPYPITASKCSIIKKPRTVEDVLAELEGMRGDNATYEDVVARCSELACELRELMGDDAE